MSEYLSELHLKYPDFDPSTWIPPTFRNRIDSDGWIYTNIRYNRNTKTHIYDIKKPNEKSSGPFHGRGINEFLKMKEYK